MRSLDLPVRSLVERSRREPSPIDLSQVEVVLACGVDIAAQLASRSSPGTTLVVGLRAGETLRSLEHVIDDFVHLDAPADELRQRLRVTLSRSARRWREAAAEPYLAEIVASIDELVAVTSGDASANLYISPAYDVITGTSREEILERPERFLRLVHPDDHQVLFDAFAHRDERYEYQYRIQRPDGQLRWLRARAFPVQDGDGSTARVITITRDVTEAQRAADDATAQRALLEGVTRALTMLLTAVEPESKIDDALAVLGPASGADRVYVARHHRDDGGTPRIALTHEWFGEGRSRPSRDARGAGRTPAVLEARELLDRIEQSASVELLRSQLPREAQARIALDDARSMLIVPIHADGGCWGQVGFVDCRLERRWDAASRAILEATAAALGSTVMRARAMEALAEQVSSTRRLYESAASSATLAPRAQLAKLLEVGAELLDMSLVQVLRVHPGHLDEAEIAFTWPEDGPLRPGMKVPLSRELWDAAVSENRVVMMSEAAGSRHEDSPAHREHGLSTFVAAPIWLDAQPWGGVAFLDQRPRGRPYRESECDLVRMIASAVARLLERIRVEEERAALEVSMRETQKLESIGLLAGGIAHDFNNLLMGIVGYAALAEREAREENTSVRESLEQVRTIVSRAADLTRQMLAYAGRGQMRVEPTSLNGLVAEMSEILAVAIPKDARLHLSLDPALPAVLGDRSQLQQVVMNLITNAADALDGAPGTISVRAWSTVTSAPPSARFVADRAAAGRYVVLEVRDTGMGMDPATAERIFEPFYSTKGHGRGLGLATVLGLVRAHGGALEVESKRGEGTTFRVHLPAATDDAVVSPTPARSTERLEARVLVVDDTAEVRRTLARLLAQHGASVTTASDGAEGVRCAVAADPPFDLVLLDLTMPVLDGARAHEELRRLFPELPILVMSGYADAERVEELLADGRTEFLAKPFDTAALLSALRALTPESRH